jgi:5'(3')-deoxyribonucleotidase
MKFFELANQNQKSRPVVYLDMDGVLADMWGEVAKHHGVSNWRRARKEQRVDQVAKEPGFFRNLPPLTNAGKLVKSVLRAVGQFSILSSPLMSRVDQSSEEKADWLKHHLKKYQPQSIIFDHNKEKYARQSDGTPNILIDDYDTNIQLWRERGGIGILYDYKKIDDVLGQLSLALHGRIETSVTPHEQVQPPDPDGDKYYTSQDVVKYVKGIHNEYHLEKPILAHKVWELKMVPVAKLNTPERYDQDDPYRRVIDVDWDHVKGITAANIQRKPIVIDERGWILDGNHRVVAARSRAMKWIPAYVPVIKSQIKS